MTEDVPANRGVQYMEKVMGGCVLVWPRVKDILTEMLKALEKMRRPLSVSNAATLHKIRALVRLLSCYAPAIFIIGNTLRKSNWEGRDLETGHHAHSVLQYSLAVLVSLCGTESTKVEYVQSISLALLCSPKWNWRCPGVLHVEEPCEARLSAYARSMHNNPQVNDLTGLNNLFITLPLPNEVSTHAREIVPQRFIDFPLTNVKRFYRTAGSQDQFFVEWRSGKTVTPKPQWDTDWRSPPCIAANRDMYVQCLRHSVKLIVAIIASRLPVGTLTHAGVPRTTTREVARCHYQLGQILRRVGPVRRVIPPARVAPYVARHCRHLPDAPAAPNPPDPPQHRQPHALGRPDPSIYDPLPSDDEEEEMTADDALPVMAEAEPLPPEMEDASETAS